jgi:hypothetical protein
MQCGCLLAVGLIAALVYCIMHGWWIAAAGVVALGCLVGWLGFKAMRESNRSA